jgi:hypothetical protein
MSNKNVKELVKNVIEENAVAFKATLNRTLYSKIGQKLQEKYVEVSKNIFEMANVEVAAAEASGAVGDTNAQTSAPSGSQGQDSQIYNWPDYEWYLKELKKDKSIIPEWKKIFGDIPPGGPDPDKYPPLLSNDPQYKKDKELYDKLKPIYKQAVINHENWKQGQRKKEELRQKTKGRS